MRNFVIGLTIGALIMFAIVNVPAVFAQSKGYESAYVKQAVKDIEQIESVYDVARNRMIAHKGTAAAASKAYDDLEDLLKGLQSTNPPVAVVSIHRQIVFAAQRCENYIIPARSAADNDLSNPFGATIAYNLHEFCAVQIQAAKLRLIDYAVANGVNPFAK